MLPEMLPQRIPIYYLLQIQKEVDIYEGVFICGWDLWEEHHVKC